MTQAQNAKLAAEKASILENIDTEIASYNIDTIIGDSKEVKMMLKNLCSKELIDEALCSDGYKKIDDSNIDSVSIQGVPKMNEDGKGFTVNYSVKKGDYQILLTADDDGIYRANFGEVNISAGGSVEGGTTLVTSKAFESEEGVTDPKEKGKFTIDNDASVMFIDEVNGELSILVKSGKHAEVNIFKNMTLTNSGIKRSAIDIETGGKLDLWIAEGAEVTVNSGLGENAVGAAGGNGGYAGIHVPLGATLNLAGGGTIKAIGGDAGDGSSYGSGNISNGGGGAGGGGAGAGIGGNGGKGGAGASGTREDGFAGENCGNITISDNLTIYSYGGAGGDGGPGLNSSSHGGGGGYPGAGIGGGGAGGGTGTPCCAGGGGYSGGSTGMGDRNLKAVNGMAGYPMLHGQSWSDCGWNGGGYFEGPSQEYTSTELKDISGNVISNVNMITCIGGIGNQGWATSHITSNGGSGGEGGIIVCSSAAKVYAYNGNRYTDSDVDESHIYNSETAGLNQCPIYLQRGIKNTIYKYTGSGTAGSGHNLTPIIKMQIVTLGSTGNSKSGYINRDLSNKSGSARNVTIKIGGVNTSIDMAEQGIGSGAGYIETSNGTYTVQCWNCKTHITNKSLTKCPSCNKLLDGE